MRTAWLAPCLVLAACGGDPAGAAFDAPPGGADDAAPLAGERFPSDLVDLVARSGWVFRATVTELTSSADARIRVDQVSVQPLEAELVPGSTHTLLHGDTWWLAVGDEAYFFVTWQSAGVDWTFIEQGKWSTSLVGWDDFHAKVHEVARYLLDQALFDRLAGAARVIRGSVVSIADEPGDGLSDNQPDWWVAQVAPRNTLRGPVDVAETPVRFEGSSSFCCYEMPKLEVGDERILLLYPDDGVTGHAGDASVVADPLDVLPVLELERVRSLIASPPTPPVLD